MSIEADTTRVREVFESRTAVSKEFLNRDGSHTVEISSAPLHFRQDGQWIDVDNSLVADEAHPGAVRNKANGWTVRFASLSQGAVTIEMPEGALSFAPEGAADVAPVVGTGEDADVVMYPDAWPGVDLRYTVSSSAVREEIVVKTLPVSASFPFKVKGGQLVAPKGGGRGLDVAGPLAGKVVVAEPEPVTAKGKVAHKRNAAGDSGPVVPALTARALDGDTSLVSLEVDADWAASVTETDLPVVIDPDISVPAANLNDWRTYSSAIAGTRCSTSADPGCAAPRCNTWADAGCGWGLRTGNYKPNSWSNNAFWRSMAHFPYEGYLAPEGWVRRVSDATLHLTWAAGDTSAAHPVWSYHATDFHYDATVGGAASGSGWVSPGGSVDLDVTNLLDSWIQNRQPGGWIGFRGDETACGSQACYTYTSFSTQAAPATLSFTYNTHPPAPTQAGPANGMTVVAGGTPTLRANAPTTDPDGDAVYHRFLLATGPDAQSGMVADSGWLTSTTAARSWQIPEGVLRDGQTYYWKAQTYDARGDEGYGWPTRESGVWWFRVDRKTGAGGASPTDTVGPVTVNLVTGNAALGVSTPSMSTVGGSIGAGLTYNSTQELHGLDGTYYRDADANGEFSDTDPVVLRRIDSQLNFNWGGDVPTPALATAPNPNDRFLARWTGFINFPNDPATAEVDQWQVGYRSDDGIRVFVDNMGAPLPGGSDWTGHPVHPAPVWTTSTPYNGGTGYRQLKVEYVEHVGLAEVYLWVRRVSDGKSFTVPADWLSYDPVVVPYGWKLTAGDMDAEYNSARVAETAVTLTSPDGTKSEYKKAPTGGYTPPAGDDDVVAVNADGTVTVNSASGQVYTFRADGQLDSVTPVEDDKKPAAPKYVYDSIGVLQRIEDRLDPTPDPSQGRKVRFTYENGTGSCPAIPAVLQPQGPDTLPPSGMLCKVSFWDGRQTELFYRNKQLTWVRNPGDAYWGFGYNSANQVIFTVDPLQFDKGLREATEIHYDATARADWVKLVEPVAEATRPQHSYAYPTYDPNSDFTGGTTTVQVVGTPGTFRTVKFDQRARLIEDSDALGRTTKTFYKDPANLLDTSDLVTKLVGPDGLQAITSYDYANRPRTKSVPHPAGQAAPVSTTSYDEWQVDPALKGLGATWWTDRTDLAGPPKAFGTGIGAGGVINTDIAGSTFPINGATPSNWSVRLTGEVIFPTAGTWHLATHQKGGVRLFVDDKLAYDAWSEPAGDPPPCDPGWRCGSGVPVVVGADNERHKIRIDYFDSAGAAGLRLWWHKTGWEIAPGENLSPRYGLVTTTIDADGKTTQTKYSDATSGVAPHHGLATATITDPAGLVLTDRTAYETVGVGYLRRTKRTLPGDNATTYEYYGDTETRGNPCPGGAATGNQGGKLVRSIDPDPDGAGLDLPLKHEQVYDAAGRVVASKTYKGTLSGEWVCTAYDNRDRPLTVTYPDPDGTGPEPPRVVTYNYAVGGDPLVSSASDSTMPATNRTVTTTVDLLGRPVSYTDVWGKTTTSTYDPAGRLDTTNSNASGLLDRDYNEAGELTQIKHGSNVLANNLTYDAAGRIKTVTYPSGAGTAGNGTTGSYSYDPNRGTLTGISWTGPGGAPITSDAVTRDLASGDVIDQTIDGVDARPGANNFGYDQAGRLTEGWTPDLSGAANHHRYNYTFGTPTGCDPAWSNPNTAKNANRTRMTDTPTTGSVTTVDYCYDHADRIRSVSPAGPYSSFGYDDHGNTTTLGSESHFYDRADRHYKTAAGSTVVSYQRDATDRITSRTATTGVSLTAAFVVGHPAALTAGEIALRDRLVSSGYQVSLVDDAAAASTSQNVIVISPSTSSTTLGTKYRDVNKPIVTLQAGSWQPLGLATANGTGSSSTTMSIASPSHPAAGGLTGTVTVTSASQGIRYVAASALGAGAQRVANHANGSPTDFAYETGAARPSGLPAAPARRIAIGFATGTPTVLTADGWRLFDAAAVWAAPGGQTGTTTRYSYTATGDTGDATLDPATNNVIEMTLSLPGGAIYTTRTGGNVWSYPNIHGDIAAVANQAGVKQGQTYTYDPYGNSLVASGAIPDNSNGSMDYGWLGQHERPFEHQAGLIPVIEMGARQYDPRLGRFLGVDRVEGGSANAYSYCSADPLNCRDLDGLDEEHTSGKRKSTQGKHEKGQKRRKTDKGGEKGDARRRGNPNKRNFSNFQSGAELIEARRRANPAYGSNRGSFEWVPRALGALGTAWLAAKVLSPACGPAAPACVVVL